MASVLFSEFKTSRCTHSNHFGNSGVHPSVQFLPRNILKYICFLFCFVLIFYFCFKLARCTQAIFAEAAVWSDVWSDKMYTMQLCGRMIEMTKCNCVTNSMDELCVSIQLQEKGHPVVLKGPVTHRPGTHRLH